MRHWRHKKGRGGGAKSRGCGRGGLIDEVCSEGGKGKFWVRRSLTFGRFSPDLGSSASRISSD